MPQDLKFGIKLLWKDKAFTVTALLTLALCIGANTAIFTVLNAVILNSLPYAEPDRLVSMYNIYPGLGLADHGANAAPDYYDRRAMSDVFESVALVHDFGYDMGAEGSPVRIQGEKVTRDYFHVLRASAMAGRTFNSDDGSIGKEKAAILSYGLWKEMFAQDPRMVGKDIRIAGVPYRVVGILPGNFRPITAGAKLWTPIALKPQEAADSERHSNHWGMIGRLQSGVTVSYAKQRLDILNKRNVERFPKYRKLLENARFGTVIRSMKDELTREVRPTLYLLQAAVAFVLLIGCVNVANLMLVRSNIRMKEMAIRFSLGAGRLRLSRQLLTESFALAVAGGALGVFVGFAGVRLLNYLGAKDMPRGADIRVDTGVLAFSAAVAIVTGLIFGSVPVYHLLRRDLNAVFRQTERTGTTQKGALWTRSALVVCQVSLAFVLLIGAGLLALSFVRLLSVSPGFQPENVTTAMVSLPTSRYQDDARALSFVNAVLTSVRAIPSVAHAGTTNYLPFGGDEDEYAIGIEGYTPAPGESPPVPGWNVIDPQYLRAMGIPLLQGRFFDESDGVNTQKVVMIDQFLAKKYWPRGTAVGGKIRMVNNNSVCTIVGVVGSVKTGNLAEQNPVGQVYFSYNQFPPRIVHLVVKTKRDDPALVSAIRREIRRADPELPMFDVKTMPERISASMQNRKAAMVVCLVFACLALVLSAIGIYGVLAYTVTQRTREFGIRMALGAGAADVVRMVTGQGIKLAAVGLAIGIGGALALTRLMTSMLFGVRPSDPLVFVSVAAALMVVAAIASLIPSIRAVRVRPAIALRYE
ncbi:MAG: ABC transporter permease [Bryobacteraceae bacterium]